MLTDSIANDLSRHIEEFAAAFMRYTNLPPDRVVMYHQVIYRGEEIVNKIWFEERRMNNDPRTPTSELQGICPGCQQPFKYSNGTPEIWNNQWTFVIPVECDHCGFKGSWKVYVGALPLRLVAYMDAP